MLCLDENVVELVCDVPEVAEDSIERLPARHALCRVAGDGCEDALDRVLERVDVPARLGEELPKFELLGDLLAAGRRSRRSRGRCRGGLGLLLLDGLEDGLEGLVYTEPREEPNSIALPADERDIAAVELGDALCQHTSDVGSYSTVGGLWVEGFFELGNKLGMQSKNFKKRPENGAHIFRLKA